MASNDIVANDEDTYNKEYRRLRTLTSQTDILETSVSFAYIFTNWNAVILKLFYQMNAVEFPQFLAKDLYSRYIKLMGFNVTAIVYISSLYCAIFI